MINAVSRFTPKESVMIHESKLDGPILSAATIHDSSDHASVVFRVSDNSQSGRCESATQSEKWSPFVFWRLTLPESEAVGLAKSEKWSPLLLLWELTT